MKSLQVSCPRCQKKFNYYESDFRPFCCEKCRLIDLGQWLNETYTVPVSKLTMEEALELEQLRDEKKQIDDEDDKLH